MAAGLYAQPAATIPTITAKTASMRKLPGYFPLYWDEKAGRLWLEITRLDTEFLYVNSLPAGIGSNDIGTRPRTDRRRAHRQASSAAGRRSCWCSPTTASAPSAAAADEPRSVEESFAQSVLWGFDVAAEEGSRVLVDATGFYLRDAHDIPRTIQRAQPIGGTPQAPTPGAPGTPRPRCSTSTPRAAPSTCRGPKTSRRTPKWKPPSPSSATTPTRSSATSRPRPNRSPCASTTPSSSSPAPASSPRAFDPRAGYFAPDLRRLRRPSRRPHHTSASSTATACKRRTPVPPSANPSSPSSTISTAARPSPSAPRCSKAPAGGTRPSKPPATAMPSASNCCPKAPTRWTSATTSSSGCIAPRAAGRTANPSPIPAPARSSRARSRSAPAAAARTT